MLKRKLLALLLVLTIVVLSACGNSTTTTETTTETSTETTETTETTEEVSGEVPHLIFGWGNELHTGMSQLSFVAPELFENQSTRLIPIGDSQMELVKDGKRLAIFDFIVTSSGADAVTLMSQDNLDAVFCSSTAVMSGYDSGADIKILGPVQSGGVSIVAAKNAPYNTFEELIEYAKSNPEPIMAGYHSPVSSPRIVLEYALKEADITVSGDAADYNADVLMSDLKGLSNLIPSLSSGQVELWAGPVPHPQNAEAQDIGKIIAKLDDLPGGKWKDFPCCTFNCRQDLIDEHPEVVQALAEVATYVHDYAQNYREETADLLSEFMGLDKAVLMENDTTYSTSVNENFIHGMNTYVLAMNDMGKFTGRLKDKTPEEVLDLVFDFKFFGEDY
ncbi:MAG: ABC transporter substrate-binding protein [Tissierellia bacterium]|nr:ABC transporter substrate-binding protein [Tissierellia bacterium]